MHAAPINIKRLEAKRDRAEKLAGDRFLQRRAFEECVDRALGERREFNRVVLVGAVEARWTKDLATVADNVEFAPLAALKPGNADLIIAIDALSGSQEPAVSAFILRHALTPCGRLLGATLGNRSLATLRRSIVEGERASGRAVQRFHPLPDGPSLASLLSGAGLNGVVVDVDLLVARYGKLHDLIGDLRAMGCTNSLAGEATPLTRKTWSNARRIFESGAEKTEETFEILHFSASAPNEV